jgi:hypothetical protein
MELGFPSQFFRSPQTFLTKLALQLQPKVRTLVYAIDPQYLSFHSLYSLCSLYSIPNSKYYHRVYNRLNIAVAVTISHSPSIGVGTNLRQFTLEVPRYCSDLT